MKRAAVVLLAACLWSSAPTATASVPRDALTEDSSTRTETRYAADYTQRSLSHCHQLRVETSLKITCGSKGYAMFAYEFAVPRKAINVRYKAAGSEKLLVEHGSRNGARAFVVFVTMGSGTHVIDAVDLKIDIPTSYDTRPCVTEGEWARINVWMGGYGGNMAAVAAVFDTNGKRTYLSPNHDGFKYQNRVYRRCGSQKTRKLTFHYANGHGWYSYWG